MCVLSLSVPVHDDGVGTSCKISVVLKCGITWLTNGLTLILALILQVKVALASQRL